MNKLSLPLMPGVSQLFVGYADGKLLFESVSRSLALQLKEKYQSKGLIVDLIKCEVL